MDQQRTRGYGNDKPEGGLRPTRWQAVRSIRRMQLHDADRLEAGPETGAQKSSWLPHN
jgi:hypothetical protein